jgi:exopolysaccharide biosynthesis polyprenyl glycosylphosphotransferase
MKRPRPFPLSAPHLVLDVVLIVAAFLIAQHLRFGMHIFPEPTEHVPLAAYFAFALLSLPIWLAVFGLWGLYYSRLRAPFGGEAFTLISAVSVSFLGTLILSLASRAFPASRLALILIFVLALILLTVGRAILRLATNSVRRAGGRKPAVIFGTDPVCQMLAKRLSKAGLYDSSLVADEKSGVAAIPEGVGLVVAKSARSDLAEIYVRCEETGAELVLLPDNPLFFSGRLEARDLEGIPVISLKSAESIAAMVAIKRVADVLLGCAMLIVTSPILGVCAALIKMTSRGPVFYRHRRLGLSGAPFEQLKLRTMVKDAPPLTDEMKASAGFKLKRDPRVTPVGGWLRRLSLDELPQLVNIVKGEMSLVGPRPIVPDEMERYGPWGRLLLSVKPGLSGLWQISGRSDLTYEERIELDIYYIQNWTLKLDLAIMLGTLPAVLSRKGAY